MSRSMHRSQAMGSSERRGSMNQHFITIAGDAASRDPFDGIDTTWNRVRRTAHRGTAGAGGARLRAGASGTAIPSLVKARQFLSARFLECGNCGKWMKLCVVRRNLGGCRDGSPHGNAGVAPNNHRDGAEPRPCAGAIREVELEGHRGV
jgi:hypothetical protein